MLRDEASREQQPVVVEGRMFDGAWASLDAFGFATVSEAELGFDTAFREALVDRYFDSGELRSDLPDVPLDRERARDVVHYEWNGDTLALAEHDTITILNRDGRPGAREYSRVLFLDELPCAKLPADWVAAALSLVSPEDRPSDGRGTFGINLFRTHTNVVSGPHRDDEKFVIVYVVAKVGGGAETRLHDAETDEVVYSTTLNPGDLIIFKDARFRHGVTPLRPTDGRRPHRDALVCTVNYDPTYPLHRWLWTSSIPEQSRRAQHAAVRATL